MKRRDVLRTSLIGAAALAFHPALALAPGKPVIDAQLDALEKRSGGRLGVAIHDTGNGHHVAHRGEQRFLMCSTWKVLAVAAVLARVDHTKEQLDRRIVFGKKDLLSYAPVTRHHVGPPGMRVDALCQAAITLSDNTAANVLLASLGGPPAVTAFVRSLGDSVTRLDRNEPSVNATHPGDVRDTTTPNAMLATLHKLLLGDVLSPASRDQLHAWMRACKTGTGDIRAGVPAGWTVGDKTGSGEHNETNDIAVIQPPNRKPLLVTAYYAGSHADRARRHAVLAQVGRIAALL